MVPLLLFVAARITGASGGPADAYVAHIKQALSLLKPGQKAGRAATLHASLSQAYGWAGLLREALAANDAALRELSEVDRFDDRFLGYRVEHWIASLRGRFLALMGRFAEAEPWLEGIRNLDPTMVDPTVQFIAHFATLEIACHFRGARLAAAHSRRVAEIAERHGSPYLRVFALISAGMAKSVVRDYSGARSDFAAALDRVRVARAAVDFEAEILAGLADCYYRLEDHPQAIAASDECLKVARLRNSRMPECRAMIIRGATIAARRTRASRPEAEGWFLRAEQMIRLTSAEIYAPLLAEARALLLDTA